MSFPVNSLPPRTRFRARLAACPASQGRHAIWISKTLGACRHNREPQSVAVEHILAHSLWPVCRAEIEARAAEFYAQ
jgi:hypothetical protein